MHRPARLIFLALLLLAAPVAAVDWTEHANEDTVVVVTQDEDGSTRETTVWLLVLEGEAYLRTGDSSWGRNLDRGSPLSLRVANESYAVGFSPVEDEALFERICQGFRDKYGFSDWLVDLVPGMGTRAFRLTSPAGA